MGSYFFANEMQWPVPWNLEKGAKWTHDWDSLLPNLSVSLCSTAPLPGEPFFALNQRVSASLAGEVDEHSEADKQRTGHYRNKNMFRYKRFTHVCASLRSFKRGSLLIATALLIVQRGAQRGSGAVFPSIRAGAGRTGGPPGLVRCCSCIYSTYPRVRPGLLWSFPL